MIVTQDRVKGLASKCYLFQTGVFFWRHEYLVEISYADPQTPDLCLGGGVDWNEGEPLVSTLAGLEIRQQDLHVDWKQQRQPL